MARSRWVILGAISFLGSACGNRGTAKTPADVACPPGQSYDGQYCVVDQKVATVEQPIPAQPTGDEPAETAPETAPSVKPTEEDPADLELTESSTSSPQGGEKQSGEVLPAQGEPTSGDAPVLARKYPPATPVDYAMAAQAAPVMNYLASSHLPAGSKPLGAPFAGQFAEGQGLSKKVQLSADKCYTIVGIGLPPILELDILLMDPTGEETLASDETSGAQAVVGSRDDCFRPERTGPVSLLLVAEKGQGVAAAQVFQK